MDALRSLEISSAPFVQRTPDVCLSALAAARRIGISTWRHSNCERVLSASKTMDRSRVGSEDVAQVDRRHRCMSPAEQPVAPIAVGASRAQAAAEGESMRSTRSKTVGQPWRLSVRQVHRLLGQPVAGKKNGSLGCKPPARIRAHCRFGCIPFSNGPSSIVPPAQSYEHGRQYPHASLSHHDFDAARSRIRCFLRSSRAVRDPSLAARLDVESPAGMGRRVRSSAGDAFHIEQRDAAPDDYSPVAYIGDRWGLEE